MEHIRIAHSEDAKQIRDIYAPYVEKTAITFETEIPSLAEIKERIATNSKYGWFVFESENKILAYAYACRHRDRTAYQWCCETSVYVREGYQRQGLASALYKKLFLQLKEIGLVNLYAGITLPNEASIKLHESFGFTHVGTYPKIGYKLKAWRDVGWWELKINTPRDEPRPL